MFNMCRYIKSNNIIKNYIYIRNIISCMICRKKPPYYTPHPKPIYTPNSMKIKSHISQHPLTPHQFTLPN